MMPSSSMLQLIKSGTCSLQLFDTFPDTFHCHLNYPQFPASMPFFISDSRSFILMLLSCICSCADWGTMLIMVKSINLQFCKVKCKCQMPKLNVSMFSEKSKRCQQLWPPVHKWSYSTISNWQAVLDEPWSECLRWVLLCQSRVCHQCVVSRY